MEEKKENEPSYRSHVDYSVGSTTDEPSLTDQIKRYKPRKFKEPESSILNKANAPSAANERLTEKCIKVIVENFSENPSHHTLPSKHMLAITSLLPIDLDPGIAAIHVHDEGYWKRCCLQSLGTSKCQIIKHGLTWKQLFFEFHLQDRLENFDAETESFDDLLEEIKKFQDYIFTLTFTQLPSHIEIDQITAILPNLTKLSIQYSLKKIGMKYDRMLFGMKISDASSLAKSIKNCNNLTSCVASGNLIDDDLLRMLMTGLYKSCSITHLDVSHNKITNHGVRLLSKLLGSKSVLTSLNIADNQIHAEGGRYLGRALRTNDSLSDLNLRLNRLSDEGGRMLFEGLRDNESLTRLNISSNSLARESMSAISVILREPENQLAIVDLSANQLSTDDVGILAETLGKNSRILSLDLRANKCDDEELLQRIEEIVHRNELKARSG